jgi:MFS superfamily sulfate permease-like transporter
MHIALYTLPFILRATFALIMSLGLEAGIAAGIVCSTLYFAYEYARSQVSKCLC